MTYNPYGAGNQSDVDLEGLQIAKDAINHAEDADVRLDQLESRVNNLSIINEALYDLLVTRVNLSESELAAAMVQVTVNRKNRLEAKLTCASCSMQVPASRHKCMYCGGNLLGEVSVSPFDV